MIGNLAAVLGRALAQRQEAYHFTALLLLHVLSHDLWERDTFGVPVVVWNADRWLRAVSKRHGNKKTRVTVLPPGTALVVRKALAKAELNRSHQANTLLKELQRVVPQPWALAGVVTRTPVDGETVDRLE